MDPGARCRSRSQAAIPVRVDSLFRRATARASRGVFGIDRTERVSAPERAIAVRVNPLTEQPTSDVFSLRFEWFRFVRLGQWHLSDSLVLPPGVAGLRKGIRCLLPRRPTNNRTRPGFQRAKRYQFFHIQLPTDLQRGHDVIPRPWDHLASITHGPFNAAWTHGGDSGIGFWLGSEHPDNNPVAGVFIEDCKRYRWAQCFRHDNIV